MHIVQSFKERLRTVKEKEKGKEKRKFVLYSAHDYTINAMLTHVSLLLLLFLLFLFLLS